MRTFPEIWVNFLNAPAHERINPKNAKSAQTRNLDLRQVEEMQEMRRLTTKLASELLVQEYAASYGLKAVINRCGVIAGPGQFGKVDQGVFTLWVANHAFGKALKYTGFGGAGKQVRDLLHPDDLFRAITAQLGNIESLAGETFNLGGGQGCSTSLLELTALCQKVTGRSVPITSEATSAAVDIPFYVSDCAKAEHVFGWKREKSVNDIVGQIYAWLDSERERLAPLFGA